MAQHIGTPKAHRSYDRAFSAACSKYGDGQCDGIIPDSDGEEFMGEDCACDCHSGWGDCPLDSISAVAAWHAEQHRLFG